MSCWRCLVCRAYIVASVCLSMFFFFFFNDTATTEIYTLSLHDALPILLIVSARIKPVVLELLPQRELGELAGRGMRQRSEEHTSELQSPCNLVCRLLLEKKKTRITLRTVAPVQTILCLCTPISPLDNNT